jgi:hypothetical protein
MNNSELKEIAEAINEIDHDKIQLDCETENKKRDKIFEQLDSLEREKAMKLLFHVIHAQQLKLLGAKILYDYNNPCKTVIDFEFIESYCFTKEEIKNKSYQTKR